MNVILLRDSLRTELDLLRCKPMCLDPFVSQLNLGQELLSTALRSATNKGPNRGFGSPVRADSGRGRTNSRS